MNECVFSNINQVHKRYTEEYEKQKILLVQAKNRKRVILRKIKIVGNV